MWLPEIPSYVHHSSHEADTECRKHMRKINFKAIDLIGKLVDQSANETVDQCMTEDDLVD